MSSNHTTPLPHLLENSTSNTHFYTLITHWNVSHERFVWAKGEVLLHSEARALRSPTKLSLAYFPTLLQRHAHNSCLLLLFGFSVSFRSLSKSTNVTPAFVWFFFLLIFRVFFLVLHICFDVLFLINSLLHKYDNNTPILLLFFFIKVYNLVYNKFTSYLFIFLLSICIDMYIFSLFLSFHRQVNEFTSFEKLSFIAYQFIPPFIKCILIKV